MSEEPKGHLLDDRTLWEVYARRRYDDPLAHVGTLASDDEELARVYARTIYNEFPWVEMVLFPRAAGIVAIRA